MAIDLYKTQTMLAAIKRMEPTTTFLRDRYFPMGETFPTEEVLVEYMDVSGNKMAPVVMPRKGSITVEREGYTTHRMAPPLVAPSRPLTIDELNKKGFGEALFSDRTPAARQAEILVQDLADFDKMITTREEYIASKCMFGNGYVLRQYSDKYGEGEFTEFELRFYEGTNPAVYAPATMWDAADADIFADLHLMIRMLTTRGNNATEVLVGSDVADALMRNATIKELMDLRRYEVGSIAPVELPQGTARLGRLNIRGRNIDLLTYDGTYIDEQTGAITPYIPEKQICLTAPNAGSRLYGCVTQMEQNDGQWHSYTGTRIPQYWADREGRQLTVSSRPLLVPRTKDPFITATVLK